jgi:hypothetical protein
VDPGWPRWPRECDVGFTLATLAGQKRAKTESAVYGDAAPARSISDGSTSYIPTVHRLHRHPRILGVAIPAMRPTSERLLATKVQFVTATLPS